MAVDCLTQKCFHTYLSVKGVRGLHIFGPMNNLKCMTQAVASVLLYYYFCLLHIFVDICEFRSDSGKRKNTDATENKKLQSY